MPRPTLSCALPLLLLLLQLSAASAAAEELFARDGFGRPVAWWAVLKLPMHVRAAADVDATDGARGHVRPTPCDCAAPDCANAPTADLDVAARAAGLCYLYADAARPVFQHFRALGYDCLGQGGNDPVSHTLRQLQLQPASHGEEQTQAQEPYWAIFNDQLNGIARSYKPRPTPAAGSPQLNRSGTVCSGGNLFSAHAKGAVGFRSDTGGFFLQTSTPNFPDPTPVSTPEPGFVRLGCQVDNNLQFAQHLFAMSLDMPQLELLGTQLQVARLCSGNFYGADLRELLASKRLYVDGGNASANGNFSGLYDALLNAKLPEREQSATLNLTLKQATASTDQTPRPQLRQRASVYVEPASGQSLAALSSQLQHDDRTESASRDRAEYGPRAQQVAGGVPEVVHVIIKSPKATVPPWALVAESLETDISVASWWDGSYGIPNVCAGDDYSRTRNEFCLEDAAHDVHLVSANGKARFNIENLVEATWKLANDTLTWHLVGGQEPDGNHAKWALTSPRDGIAAAGRAVVTFADLNMEGFPCSAACNGSQAGRGGSFFSLPHAALHASLAQTVVSKACRCRGPSQTQQSSVTRDGADGSFADVRMCHFGCWRKVEARFSAEELPRLAPNASSFWPE